MKVLINPLYNHLADFINNIPERFEDQGKVIYSGRNLIKVMTLDGVELNVKRYAIPAFVNKIAYSFFRVPKGKRAFTYPQVLFERGFETPCPIAYVEERKFGLINYSYFISLQSSYSRNFYEFGNADVDQCKDVIVAFARYSAKLHEAGILHRDYSPGNILFEQIDGEYHFSLVDINRMNFGRVSIRQGCANFARLWGKKSFFELLAKEYAKARHADESFCKEHILACRKKFWKNFAKKHIVKYKLEY